MLIYDVYNPKRTTLKSDIDAYKKKWANNQEALNALEKQYNDMAAVDKNVRSVIDLLEHFKNQQEDQKKSDSEDSTTVADQSATQESPPTSNAAKQYVDGVDVETIRKNQEETKKHQAETDRLLKNVRDAAKGVDESATTPEEQKKNNAKKTPYYIKEDYDDYSGLAD